MRQPKPTTHRVIVDGLPTFYRSVAPNSEKSPALALPILLLHGLGCSGAAWEPTLRELGLRPRCGPVLAPDLPGFGCSANLPHVLSIRELADWLVKFLDAQTIRQAHLAGNSLGCQIALAMARRHPDRVGRLVLIGPTTGGRGESLARYGVGLLRDGAFEPPHYNFVLAQMYAQMGLPRYLTTVKSMLDDDPLGEAGLVSAPCLIIRGGNDGIIPEHAARALVDALPQAKYQEIPKSAHALQFSHPKEFVQAAWEFWMET